ncbi:WD40-repeat-containing domain protein [Dichotomocladium elegans]|nr:WD40-repeat-containing domain protein [Dichotomocladium elegans]
MKYSIPHFLHFLIKVPNVSLSSQDQSSSAASSVSEHLLAMTPVHENDFESSEDETHGAIYFGMSSKSAALPIPNAAQRSYSRQTAASSASSSQERRAFGSSPSGSITPTASATYGQPQLSANGMNGTTPPPTLTVEDASSSNTAQDDPGTSIGVGPSSSVGSISSLFSRNSLRHHHHHLYSNHPRKPKNSLIKTNSSFISKIVVNDQLSKILASRLTGDPFLFYNVGVNFLWADGTQRIKDSLCKMSFARAFPTCHDTNITTACGDYMDVVIGFTTGDCMWYDPISSKYTRLNKGGIMNSSCATAIKWIPGSEELFMVSFNDGAMLILDKERDDQQYMPPPPVSWAEQQFHATKPRKSGKYNPVSHWKVSDKGITSFEFSPDGSHVGVVSSDGTLRVIDYRNERLCDVFTAYFGKINCIAWSPDGRYLLTGGQDDLVTIWSVMESRIVARCQGHKSWVTAVAFDPWRCDDHVYRFGSVGEDCKLILWDFSFGALHRPKHKMRMSFPPRSPKEVVTLPGSSQQPTTAPPVVTTDGRKHMTAFSRFKRRSSRGVAAFGNGAVDDDDSDLYHPEEALHSRLATVHPILNKDQVPFLQPIVVQAVHPDPCSSLTFRKDAIVTADRRGRIRTWARP